MIGVKLERIAMLRVFKNKQPVLGENVYIDESAVVIGDVIVGDDVSVLADHSDQRRCRKYSHW